MRKSLIILKIILLIEAAFWVVVTFNNAVAYGLDDTAHIVVSVLTLLDAAAYAILAFLLKYWKLPVKLLLLLLLLANTALTFTDQVGVWDYIFLALNLGALVFFVLAAIPKRKKE